MQPTQDTAALAKQAQSGDKTALSQILRHAQDKVHRLAVRMLVDPDTAQDATQEVLIRIMTKPVDLSGR